MATYHPFEGVDPNTLSCDPEGQIFLLLPHSEDCDKFYICAHGQEILFQCPEGTIFDFELQGCEWSWAAKCQLRNPNKEDSIEESFEGSGDSSEDLWSSKDNPKIGILDLLSGADVKPTEAQNFRTIMDCESPASAAKQLPYRGDCQRYWRCSNGVPQAAYCSDGLFFNERTQQCDFEANSQCVDSQHNELAGEFIEYK
ncbi:peritrophin-1-like [Cydia amplana]|uniref:peritrophin-1-like n=1 Tax=Cydia amplana TaxID=1869771 RepID=UPI002FE6C0D9